MQFVRDEDSRASEGYADPTRLLFDAEHSGHVLDTELLMPCQDSTHDTVDHLVVCSADHGLLLARTGAVAVIAIALGAPSGLAAAADLLSLTALPLVAARTALAALLRWQLAAMKAMWRLLRGRGLPFRPWTAPGCVSALLDGKAAAAEHALVTSPSATCPKSLYWLVNAES